MAKDDRRLWILEEERPSAKNRRKRNGQKRKLGWGVAGTMICSLFLAGLFVLGCMTILRPESSEIEKRQLAACPEEITPEAVWTGEWFGDVQTWYEDTYPYRESLLYYGSKIDDVYGLKGEEIHNASGRVGEEIPKGNTEKAPVIEELPDPETPEEEAAPALSEETAENDTGETVSTEAALAADETLTGDNAGTANTELTGDNAGAANTELTGDNAGAANTELTGDNAGTQNTELTGDTAGTTEAAPAGNEAQAEAAPADGAAEPENLPDGTINAVPQSAGTVYLVGSTGFEIFYFANSSATAYASMINTVKSRVGEGVNVYDMVVPTSFGVCLSKEGQKAIGGSDEQEAVEYIYSLIEDSVKKVPVVDELIRHNAEYIYFTTDHHWTQLGAYYAYVEFCKAKGITPHAVEDYQTVEYPDFVGTFYEYSNQAQVLMDNPDCVVAYIPIATNDMMIGDTPGNVIGDVGSARNKYMCFIGGDYSLGKIHNPTLSDGSACVLIKESFGNCFAPFLVDHYENVYIVDYRYYGGNLNQFIRDNNVQDVIFLNNVDAVLANNANQMLGMFQG